MNFSMKRHFSILAVLLLTGIQSAFGVQPPKANMEVGSAILIEPQTGTVLFEKDMKKHLIPASLVKIMTLLLTYDFIRQNNLDIDMEIVVSRASSRIGGRQAYLKENERITLRDLIKATVIFSANDAAHTLAEFVAGTEEQFVDMMNAKAQELGLADSLFCNSHGLPDRETNGEQYASAWDLARLARHLILTHHEILEYSSTKMATIRNGAFSLVNTNNLLWKRNDVIGLKTGYITAAGFSVVAVAKQGDFELICVVMGAQNKRLRFSVASQLLDFGFRNYRFCSIKELKDKKTVPVVRGLELEVPVSMIDSANIVIPRSVSDTPSVVFSLPERIEAPVPLQKHVGWVTFSWNDENCITAPLITVKEIPRKFSLWEKIKMYFVN